MYKLFFFINNDEILPISELFTQTSKIVFLRALKEEKKFLFIYEPNLNLQCRAKLTFSENENDSLDQQM